MDDMGEIPPLVHLKVVHKWILNFVNDPDAKVTLIFHETCRFLSFATIFAAQDDMGEIPPLVDLKVVHRWILNFVNNQDAEVTLIFLEMCRFLLPKGIYARPCVQGVLDECMPGLVSRVC